MNLSRIAGFDRLTRMGRRSFAHELKAAALMPAAIACVEGGVIGVIARLGFDAPDLVIAALVAAPALANVSSVLWTRLMYGRDRVKFVLVLQLLTLLSVAILAVAPYNALGIAILVFGVFAARSCLSGIITARADVWMTNYPRSVRAHVTGRLSTMTTITVSLVSLLVGAIMDAGWLGGHGYRLVYGVAILVALVGVRSYSGVRWRRGRAIVRRERAAAGIGQPHSAGPLAMVRVLRDDRDFRRYMTAQFILGMPNIALWAPFIAAMDDIFALKYKQSILLAQIIPVLIPILLMPLWARLLDRRHVIEFRAWHSWVFVIANALCGVAFLTNSLPLLYVSRVILGAAFAGGILAWNLGHHDFVKGGLATVYMGVHVTLTGIRGLFAPFLGTLLYSTWKLEMTGLVIDWPGLGGWTFIWLSGLSTLGALMFLRLHLSTRHTLRAGDDGEPVS